MAEKKAIKHRPPTTAERGRPRALKNPHGASFVLDEQHLALLRAHKRKRGFRSTSAALRDIIERFFETAKAA